MSLISDNTGEMLNQALDLRFKRQQLLVANIANIDTPNYQPVDLAFEGALERAMEDEADRDPNPPGFARTDAQHMSGWIEPPPNPSEVYVRADVTNGLDNNGVDLDREMARMTDNSVHYQTMLEATRRRFSILNELITTMNQG